uniref:EGF-like domain-containing protein n=1 Tax=Setaria digitata TaxID=48799 RepID=A0A915PNL5_9BILA
MELIFSRMRCISSLVVDSVTPLTGAEEVRHHNRRFLVLEKRMRMKRSMDFETVLEFTAENSPHYISRNITVNTDQILKIKAGTNMAFSPNTGIIVHGIVKILGTESEPVMLYAKNGTWIGLFIAFTNEVVAKQSQLIHVNVSGSSLGIRIETLLLPKIENVISDGNGNGLTVFACNNGNNFNKGHLILKEVLSTSNQVNGLWLEGTLQSLIISSQFFSNNKDGISINLTNGSILEVNDSIFGSNGEHAIQMQNIQQIGVKFFSNSFKHHDFGEAAVSVKFASHVDFLFEDCLWWNNTGGVAFWHITNTNLHLLSGNWTQNRGTTVFAARINGKTNILIENNDFQQNGIHNDRQTKSMIELGMGENDTDVSIRLHGNRIFRNEMMVILQIGRIELENMPTNAKVKIMGNSFVQNSALNTIYLATNHVDISYNIFNNSKATLFRLTCLSQKFFRLNVNCVLDKKYPWHTSMPPTITGAQLAKKRFTTSLIIREGEAAVYHEGSVLTFKPNHGIIVSGALHLLGRRDNPILLQSSGLVPWLGIILDQGGIIHASHCILKNAVIGLNISSPNVSIESMRIIRPLSAGVLITAAYNGTFDMGESTILDSSKDGIRILKRQKHDVLFIRNVQIIDSAEDGIDFVGPAGKIMMQNVVLENSGSFGILMAQKEEDELDSIILSNLTVRKQQRGSSGILLNLKCYYLLHLNTSNFVSNMLPAVTIFSKCPSDGKERKVLIEKNRFAKNDNLVMRITLEGCGNVKVRRNIFIKNNEGRRNGVLSIHVSSQAELQPSPTIDVVENAFLENKGEWSLFASATNMNPFSGTIRNNHFNLNQHSHDSLIVTSPYFHVIDNEFNNKFEQFDVDIKQAYEEALDGVGNYWENDDMATVKSNVSDSEWDKLRIGLTETNPTGRKRAADDCLAVSNCSHNGRCVGLNHCQCDIGHAGPDCSQVSCLELKNCSMNGFCVAPNVCECFDGWQRQDCSEPTCHLVNNCTGHGTCVSLNECSCEPMFEGVDCSKHMTNCSSASCNNHGLCIDSKCICETGWTGPFCSRAMCDQLNNCSGSGVCVQPQMCECSPGFTGDDCSICQVPTCDLCGSKCVHGSCNPNTRSCECRGGWTGPSCDICTTEKCDVMSVVLFVLPTAAGIHQKNEDILVYGNDLPFVPSKRYTCLYGSTASAGFYISSSLVHCTIPALAKPGRYLFNIIPHGSDKAVPFLDKRLIHFTLYNECSNVDCKGYCVGAVCICPAGRAGLFCEQVDVTPVDLKTKNLPKLDREILRNEKLVEALENEPYTVKMPIQQENTIFTVETDANGLVVYPNGVVFWAQPIGRDRPYAINVTAASATGGCVISWNVTVKPMYIPVITKVESVDDSNMKLINGIVKYNAKVMSRVPVRILVYQNSELVENGTTTSTADGYFQFKYYPSDEAISTSVIAVHPGAAKPDTTSPSNNATWAVPAFNIEYAPKIKMKLGEQVNADYQLKNDGGEELVNCQLELITPRDKIQVVKYEKLLEPIAIGESKKMKVTFAPGTTLDDTTLTLQFKCSKTLNKLIRQQVEVDRERSLFISYPSEILISTNPEISPKIIKVEIINKEGYQFVTTPRISIQPGDGFLFLVFTNPLLQNTAEFSSPESTLTLFLSYRSLVGNFSTAGDLILFEDNKQLLTIPYRSYAAPKLFDFHVSVSDELTVLDSTHVVDDAEVILRNDVLGYDVRRRIKANESAVSFSIVEGIYQLTIMSPNHVSVAMIVQPSFINSSLVVFLPICSPYSPVVEDGRLLVEETDEGRKVPFPKLHFTPSAIMAPQNDAKEVKLLVSSDLDGATDNIAVLPSVEIHDEHLPFTLATADLKNGIGLGDGYHMTCKLWPVSNQTRNFAACTVFALQIPYIYMVPKSMLNYVRNVIILVDNRNERNDKVHLCQAGLQAAPKEESIWTKTTIHCNCAMKTRERCRRQYVSLVSCGTSWRYIPDDTVSLQTTAMFIVMMAECRAAGVDFRRMEELLRCASSLDNKCPISRQRRFTKNRPPWRSQQHTQFFDQFSMVNEYADGILQKHFPILKVLASQTVDTISLYSAFFEQLNVLLPFKYFEEINDMQWFDKFFESISDYSEGGLTISQTEFRKLKSEKGGVNLAHHWNATVTEWSMSLGPFSETNFSGMKFTDAREMIIRSDRLKTLARQYGADNPFTLLHDYLGRLLSWSLEDVSNIKPTLKLINDDEDICAYAYTLITPEKPYESNEFHIKLKVINKKKEPLEFVKVTLEMVPSRTDTMPMQFHTGPLILDGIGDIGRTSLLPPNASFTAKWNLKPVKNKRLIYEAEYQAVLSLEFTLRDRRSVQRVTTQTIIFRPRPSLKIYYFISNLTVSDRQNTSLLFNVIVAFMNTGYSHLKNIRIEDIRIALLSKDIVGNLTPYRISSMISGSGIESNVLSDLHIMIPNIDSGKTRGEIRDFKVAASVDGKLIELEDTQTFTIRQFISPYKFLISLQTNSALLFYYDMEKTVMRTLAPLVTINVNEKNGTSDGKPFRQQIASFRLSEPQQQPTSFYGRVPYPIDLEHDFEILRLNQVGKDSSLKLVDLRHVWSSNDDDAGEFVHFIDDNPSTVSESIKYEIIYGNSELFLRPRFEFPVYNVPLVTENWPHIGDEIARITAISASQSKIRYELDSNSSKATEYFSIDPETGAVKLKKEIQTTETESNYCITVRATDDQGRSETTVVTIGFDGFVRDCQKMDNFSGLTSHPSKVAIDVNDDGTSEIPGLFLLSHGANETRTSEDDAHEITPLTTRKHGYTKLIATQSVSKSVHGFDATLNSSSTSFSSSGFSSGLGSELSSDLSLAINTSSATVNVEGGLNVVLSSSTDLSNESSFTGEGSSTRMHIAGAVEKALNGEIHGESTEINGREITWGERHSSGTRDEETSQNRKSGAWHDGAVSTSTVGQIGISSEAGMNPLSSTIVSTDGSSEVTGHSTISLLTKDVSNTGSEEVPELYTTHSMELPLRKGFFRLATLTPNTLTSVDQIFWYTTSIYDVSTSNVTYFHLPSTTLEDELTSLENTEKLAVTGVMQNDSYQSQVLRHGSEYKGPMSTTPKITSLSMEVATEVSNIQSGSNIPLTPSSGGMFLESVNKENIPEIACRLKDVQPIWSLICDLSKTSKIEKE